MKMRKLGMISVACVLSLATFMIAPLTTFADEPDTESETVTPTIEVQKDGWLIISFAGKVADKAAAAQQLDSFLARALAEMVSSRQDITATDGGGFGLRSGYNYMDDEDRVDFGNSYVRDWFGTNTSWSSTPASFWGSSSSAWFGTLPSYTCDITIHHTLQPSGTEAYIDEVPDDWDDYITFASSPDYYVGDDWYLGTAWSGLTASYPWQVTMGQVSESAFDFGGPNPRILYALDTMDYGD